MLVVEGGEIAEYVVPHIPRCRLELVGCSLGPVVAILRSWGPVSYGHCYGDSYVHSYRDSYGTVLPIYWYHTGIWLVFDSFWTGMVFGLLKVVCETFDFSHGPGCCVITTSRNGLHGVSEQRSAPQQLIAACRSSAARRRRRSSPQACHSSTAQQLGADARQLVARTPRCSSTTDYRGSTARRCSNLYRSSIARHSLTALQFGSTRQLSAAQRTLVAARQLGVFSSMSGTNFCVMGLSPQVGCSHTPSGHTRCRARGCVRGIRW